MDMRPMITKEVALAQAPGGYLINSETFGFRAGTFLPRNLGRGQ